MFSTRTRGELRAYRKTITYKFVERLRILVNYDKASIEVEFLYGKIPLWKLSTSEWGEIYFRDNLIRFFHVWKCFKVHTSIWENNWLIVCFWCFPGTSWSRNNDKMAIRSMGRERKNARDILPNWRIPLSNVLHVGKATGTSASSSRLFKILHTARILHRIFIFTLYAICVLMVADVKLTKMIPTDWNEILRWLAFSRSTRFGCI